MPTHNDHGHQGHGRRWHRGHKGFTGDPDVVIIGAGGDGPALAWKLADHGLNVLILEAGPWHGNKKWPKPHEDPGARRSDDPDDLSGRLLDRQFNLREEDTNDDVTGKFRDFGPADRSRPPWTRVQENSMAIMQIAGVGGTTLHYYANHPRASVPSVESRAEWPIGYSDLVPYYQTIEDKFGFSPGVTTPKEEMFYHAADQAGLSVNDSLNVTTDQMPSVRPTPSLIDPPDDKLRDRDYDGPFTYPEVEGDTLFNDDFMGAPTPREAPVEEKARNSSNVSWVPEALKTGHVAIQPNTFVTNIVTEEGEARGVEYRDTWRGTTGSVDADVVVLAAGCIETPRLWLNSGLPDNGWVGRGLTTHWFDIVHGVFPKQVLRDAIGEDTIDPFVGQTMAARLETEDGIALLNASTPALLASSYGPSASGFDFMTDEDGVPWDGLGSLFGKELKLRMSQYRRTLSFLISVDDNPVKRNGVSLAPQRDEHGRVPSVQWLPTPEDTQKRNKLAVQVSQILKQAGAEYVHRCNIPPLLLHLHSSMAMGKVVDTNCEALEVDRLFVGDHSAIPNALGGQNPTHTGQALALRTADKIKELYF